MDDLFLLTSSHVLPPQPIHPSLQQHLQLQSVPKICNQYCDLIKWFQIYHAQYFSMFEHYYQPHAPKSKIVQQKSWKEIISSLKTKSSNAPPPIQPPKLPAPASLGKTRPYKMRSMVHGFCNDKKTVSDTPIPETPMALYKQPNPNRDDRLFMERNQTIRIFQFTQSEWIQFAQQCLKDPRCIRWNHIEPLQTYIRYTMKMKDESKPCIFGPKLTTEQKRELLDAFYWVNMKHDETYKSVLFFYKLYGYYVRIKDGYRITKHHDARQLILKRNELIQNGSISLHTRPKVDPNRLKSARGRKRKVNV